MSSIASGPIRGFMAAPPGGEPMYMIGEHWFTGKDTEAISAGKKPYVTDDGNELFWIDGSWISCDKLS